MSKGSALSKACCKPVVTAGVGLGAVHMLQLLCRVSAAFAVAELPLRYPPLPPVQGPLAEELAAAAAEGRLPQDLFNRYTVVVRVGA